MRVRISHVPEQATCVNEGPRPRHTCPLRLPDNRSGRSGDNLCRQKSGKCFRICPEPYCELQEDYSRFPLAKYRRNRFDRPLKKGGLRKVGRPGKLGSRKIPLSAAIHHQHNRVCKLCPLRFEISSEVGQEKVHPPPFELSLSKKSETSDFHAFEPGALYLVLKLCLNRVEMGRRCPPS